MLSKPTNQKWILLKTNQTRSKVFTKAVDELKLL